MKRPGTDHQQISLSLLSNEELERILLSDEKLSEETTEAMLRLLNERDTPTVFLLWGGYARAKKALITNPRHLVLETAHPSPLSAYNGFFGCRHFSKCNEFLQKNGLEPIDWQIKE